VPTPGLRWARRWWYQPRLWQQAGGEGRSNGQPNARASRPAGEAADRGQHPSRPIWTTCHDQAPPAACSRAELFQSSLICTCLSLEGDSSLQAAAQPGKSTPLRQQAVITSHLYHFRAHTYYGQSLSKSTADCHQVRAELGFSRLAENSHPEGTRGPVTAASRIEVLVGTGRDLVDAQVVARLLDVVSLDDVVTSCRCPSW